jgi:hypothetical protein
MNQTFEILAELDRKKLQQIAKGLGLKQNAKSSALISQIVAKQKPPLNPKQKPTDSASSAVLCKTSSITLHKPKTGSSAPAQACKAKTPKAATPKEVLVQPKRAVSPAPSSHQNSSKSQRTEEPPAAAAAAAASLANNSNPKASGMSLMTPEDFSESSSYSSHSSEYSDSKYNQLCNICQRRLGRGVNRHIYFKRDVQGAEMILCTATVAHS